MRKIGGLVIAAVLVASACSSSAATPVPSGPRTGHWVGSNPDISFYVTTDGRVVNLSLTAPFAGSSCQIGVGNVDIAADGKIAIDFSAMADTSAEGFLVGQLGDTAASGEYRVYGCGREHEENPSANWSAEWKSADMPA